MLKIEVSNFVAEIPYKTLEMIQQANGEEIIFFAIFKLLDKIKSELKKNNYRVVFLIKGEAYYKDIAEGNVFVYKNEQDEDLDASKHYILVLKKDNENRNSKILARIKRKLKQYNCEFDEIVVSNSQIDFFGEPFTVEGVLATNLGY
ncbi:hypothetical protein IGL98_000191 [Enterococcus sp. DIV0840]|uniref:hypothetical protein n=1 Tax=Enterococcus TaxID=1350 RepID=UPI001A8CFB3A|nr:MULTISPECIES: hypothetical protein [Enterococcus]MBO0434444.1 hypothetical protein [Enterococcus sp. DIV0849a]MBO0473851.1 hypothetical protein [Enterococcus ureasiticus]